MKDDEQGRGATGNGPGTPGGTGLRRERDAFVKTLLRKGAELTEELVAENEKLRAEVRELEADALDVPPHPLPSPLTAPPRV
jgi:hypothetical protein